MNNKHLPDIFNTFFCFKNYLFFLKKKDLNLLLSNKCVQSFYELPVYSMPASKLHLATGKFCLTGYI